MLMDKSEGNGVDGTRGFTLPHCALLLTDGAEAEGFGWEGLGVQYSMCRNTRVRGMRVYLIPYGTKL